mmetsp:Transcript_27787/g.55541  ORF Transcript_27787/g.55541 Transcript_27787/m.55541 type:complete len:247 (-) Transcript_27787:35-775(-)
MVLTLTDWLGYLGIFGACVLFASPLPTMSRIIKNNSVELFSPDPYIISFINCASWVLYALATPDRTAPLITNFIGTVVNVAYVGVFAANNPVQPSFGYKALGGFAFFAGVYVVVWHIVPSAVSSSKTDDELRSSIMGTVSDVFNVLMYGGPLTIMSTVVKTRSVEFMPLALTVGTSFCSFTWLWYGFAVRDWYVIIPNGGGAALCVCQVVLYATYCRTEESRKAFAKGGLGEERESEMEQSGRLIV